MRLLLVALLSTTGQVGESLPPNVIEPIESAACAAVVKTVPRDQPEQAVLTGCFRVRPVVNIDTKDEAVRAAVQRRVHSLWVTWQNMQVLNRGHYAVRSLTEAERAEVDKIVQAAMPQGGVTGSAGSWSGSGSKDTESFNVRGGEWRVAWRAVSTSPRTAGSLSIYVHDAPSGRMVSNLSSGDISGARQDSSVVRTPPGRYYLSIISALVNWEISISQ